MSKRVGLVHATLNALQPMTEAFQQYAPAIQTLHFLDEGLIADLNAAGKVTRPLIRRFIRLVEKAEEAGVDGVLLSCSSFTPYTPLINQLFDFPIVSIDFAMLEEAVQIGTKIGVIATVVTAAPITKQILEEIAAEKKKPIEIYTETLTDAFAALQNGEEHRHNQIIYDKVEEMSRTCDVVVLAQISMVRAMEGYTPLIS
ncbi:aspartate/glutamate racemase family protein [Paenibacillus ginsengihumi]|uniref:aspartate/glutamate racemase family protein n=1 Tax=Paenibacillus ginsengihumi TaxID=431596 RepID=UPI00037C06B8|nr:aspartate/glutamate racemase family protein [Paenibacillus ginsengihumi]